MAILHNEQFSQTLYFINVCLICGTVKMHFCKLLITIEVIIRVLLLQQFFRELDFQVTLFMTPLILFVSTKLFLYCTVTILIFSYLEWEVYRY